MDTILNSWSSFHQSNIYQSDSPSSSTSSPMSTPRSTSPDSPSIPMFERTHDAESSRRSRRSRDMFTSFRGLVGSKGLSADLPQATLDVQQTQPPISLTHAPSLPTCSLDASFRCSETNLPIPPAFYPGQSIPTVLTFNLNRFSSLPHSLNPSLTMSLVGTLHLPGGRPPRTIICVSVSLAEGLELWSRDAQQAYQHTPTSNVNVFHALPGGTYSLPLTVQVPTTPRLPPTFNLTANSSFAVTYALSVTLCCDDPLRSGSRINLAECAKPFEMMPETSPTRMPRYSSTTFSVKLPPPAATAVQRLLNPSDPPKSSLRWSIEPFLPTTAYSPTSVIPLRLILTPPSELQIGYQILVRVAVIRREYSSLFPNTSTDTSSQGGLVSETEVTSRLTWYDVDPTSGPLSVETVLPLITGDTPWQHGFSTLLNVGPQTAGTDDTISVSSSFHVAVTLGFLPIDQPASIQSFVEISLPPRGIFTPAVAGPTIDLAAMKQRLPGTVRTLPLPIIIGSVSEPRNAMQLYTWSDLHLDQSSGQEVGRVITGEALSCEDGWILAPPSYAEAVSSVPYEY